MDPSLPSRKPPNTCDFHDPAASANRLFQYSRDQQTLQYGVTETPGSSARVPHRVWGVPFNIRPALRTEALALFRVVPRFVEEIDGRSPPRRDGAAAKIAKILLRVSSATKRSRDVARLG